MLSHEQCHALLHRSAVPQSFENRGRQIGALLGMARKANVTVLELCSGIGLGDVVQQRTPAHGQRNIAVGIEELRKCRRDSRGSRAKGKLGLLDQIGRRIEHLQRVVEHIEVVIAVLLDGGQGLDLGQHDTEESQLVQKSESVDGISRQKNSFELHPLPLARRLGREGRIALGKRNGFGGNRKV